MTRDELIAALEAATGPSRGLDAEIKVEMFGERSVWCGCTGECKVPPFICPAIPAYTASLDAALTLVPDGWGVSVSLSPPEHNCTQQATLHRGNAPYFDSEEIDVSAGTAIIALCIAALRARQP